MTVKSPPKTEPKADAFRERHDMTLEEVVEAADALLDDVAPRQTRYAVNERPDVRTVRYYTTRGLLPKPLSYEGGRARYGYAHLVRLLAIKRMQADHFTLDQIARALQDKGDDDVAALVAPRVGRIDRAPSLPDSVPRPRSFTAGDAVPAPRADAAAPSPAPSPAAPSAAPLTAPSSSAPALAPGELTLELAPSGRVIVPAAVMADGPSRQRLADNLEDLARMLRAIDAPAAGGSGSGSGTGGGREP